MTSNPLLFIVGTRPEAIKVGPVIREAQSRGLATYLLLTGQHADIVRPFLDVFDLTPDGDLAAMTPNQTPASLAARVIAQTEEVFNNVRPSIVLVQGDTTSAFAAAAAAHFAGFPVGHIEAGLRSGDLKNPYPEEFNRRAISACSSLHFCPTATASTNLLHEGHSSDEVVVTGNTGIDSLMFCLRQMAAPPPTTVKTILITAHRRENQPDAIRGLCGAVKAFLAMRPEYRVVWPVHPNPAVGETVNAELRGVEGVTLCGPLDYFELCRTLRDCWLVVTDSGGIQEEAPALAKPVLVFRERTERPEVIEAGVARLVGTDPERILGSMIELADVPAAYASMARQISPYGDGRAAERIIDELVRRSF